MGYLVLVATALCSCGPRGTLGVIPAEPMAKSVAHTVFVGTDRKRVEGPQVFSSERAFSQSFARFEVQVPLNREPGTLSYPGGDGPSFAVSDAVAYGNADAFQTALNGEILAHAPDNRRVVVLVHGYNNNFAEGLFRFTQLKHDLGLDETVVHFSWPSAADFRGYLYDIESALVARDSLEELLGIIARSEASEIVIVAHSLGSLLALETLRQASLRASSPILDKLFYAVLIAPDVSVDLFESQRQTPAFDRIPVCVLSSSADRALGISARLRGGDPRLGRVTDEAEGEADVFSIIDISRFRGGRSNHFAIATSPELIALIRESRARRVDPCAPRSGDAPTVRRF